MTRTISTAMPSRQDAARLLGTIEFGPFRLHPGKRLLEKDGLAVTLGSRAMDVLIVLVERAGDVVSKQELTERLWPNITVDESGLRVHVATLRKALGDGRGGARYVANVSGRGYCFVAPVAAAVDGPVVAAPSPVPDSSVVTASASSTNLPRPLGRMIGRDSAVHEISTRLAAHRFVTLHGPGGIGKTTVAIAVAHAELSAFANEVAFVDLAAIGDSALVGSAVATLLGVAVRSGDPLPALLNFLRPRRMLLVLDSCEHVIDGVARLAEAIFREAPEVSLLATSRELLRVEGEHVCRIATLQLPPQQGTIPASELIAYPAVHLFVERAAASGHEIELNDANSAIVADICRKLDGNALAIELAAAHIGTHGLPALADLLDSRLRLLWQGRRTAPPRHQTLHAMLDWSHNLISGTERAVLRRFSIFVGGFTLQAAEAVANLPVDGRSMDASEMLEALDQLVVKSLVQANPEETPPRYRLLDTMRAYARTKLADCDEEMEVARRHATFFRTFLQQATRDPTRGRTSGDGQLDRATLLGNVLAALAWCFSDDGDRPLGVELAAAAAPFVIAVSLLDTCRRWTERALEMLDATQLGTPVEMELQSALGHSLMLTSGNSERAGAALERAGEIARTLSDRFDTFRIVHRLHLYYVRTGEITRSLGAAMEIESIAAEIDDPLGRAAAHVMLGASHHLSGDQAKARFHLEASLALAGNARPTGPGHFTFSWQPHLALCGVLWLQGHQDQAISLAGDAVRAPMSDVDPVASCTALVWTATAYGWLGDWAMVEKQAERMMAHADTHFLVPYRNVALGFKAMALIERAQLDEGTSLLRRSIARLDADRYRTHTFGFRGTLAHGLASAGDAKAAMEEIDVAIGAADNLGVRFMLPELLRIKGELCASQNDRHQAQSLFERAFAMAGQQAALSWQLRIATSMLRMAGKHGSAATARKLLADTYGRFTEGFATADLKDAKELLSGSPRWPTAKSG
ncbi:MAG: winged helix-turn-helix domain-containing protein [Alphaproteobacteria bacterium]|nr:winged helix-turn-helix domain-containing protein [Alphaproteobacteria bacterium]